MTSNAILSTLSYIKDNILTGFPVQNTFIYDEDLDFARRAKEFIAREGIFEKYEATVPNEWVLIIWNRGSLAKNSVQPRSFQTEVDFTTDGGLLGVVDSRLAEVPVTMRIVTNNIEMAENLEEYLMVHLGERLSYESSNALFGDFRAACQVGVDTDFVKETLENYGSLTAIEFSVVINFPVLLPDITELKRIESINTTIWEMEPREVILTNFLVT